MRRLSAISSLGALPGGLGLFGVALLNSITEFAGWVAVLIVAFEHGGAAESGRAMAIQLIPAALAAPLVAAAGDRFPRHRVIQGGLAAIAVSTAVIALLLRLGQPLVFVYAVAAVLAIALVAAPTALASLLVHHAQTPEQLTSFNVVATTVRSGGVLLGPLLAAAAIAIASLTWLFAVLAAAATIALVVVLFRVAPDDRPVSSLRPRDVLVDSIAGVRYAVATGGVRTVIGFLTIGQLVLGALDVIVVAVAYDQLGRGGEAAAVLSVCLAGGAVVASIAASPWVGRVRLGTMAIVGSLLLTVPIFWLDRLGSVLPVAATVAVIGTGTAIGDIGGLTLLQRAGSERMTSRVFGVYNSAALGACALGGFVAGTLLSHVSTTTAFGVIAGTGTGLIVVMAIAVGAVDRSIVGADPHHIDELRSVPFFASLPLPTLERMARTSTRRRHVAGDVLIRQGALHDREFYVLVEGEIRVTIDGVTVRHATAPDFFGEIALVQDVPRTATIAAAGDSEVVVIEREMFLESIALTSSSRLSAETVAGARLGNDAGYRAASNIATTGTSGGGVDDR